MKVFLKILKWSSLVLGTILILIITIGLIHLFSTKQLPQPIGQYDVGVTYRTVPTTRSVDFNELIDSNRTVYLKIWYPAVDPNHKEKVSSPYIEGGMKTGAQLIENPQFWHRIIIRKGVNVKTNAFVDLPIAEGRFPLLTYSHGFGMWSSDNTHLMESLASQGFVVVSISHRYQSLYVPVNKDSVLLSTTIPLGNTTETDADVKRREKYYSLNSQKELDEYHLEGRLLEKSSDRYSDIWSDDIITAIHYMKQTQKVTTDFFFQQLDTTKIGAVGFSFGGNAALNATLKDTSIRSAINMDGGVSGAFFDHKSDAAILFLTGLRTLPASEVTISHFGNFRDKNNQHHPTIMFAGARHSNFTDISMLSILLKWGGISGAADAEWMHEQKNLIVRDFFEASFIQSKFDPNKYVIKDKIVNYQYE